VPAKRYVILFATKDKAGKPTPIPQEMLEQAKAINAETQKEISPENKQHVEPLTLNPAPWTDGEVMRLNLKMMTGMEVGTLLWTADAVKVNDKDAWRIEQRLFVTANNSQEYTRVDAEKDSFAPIFGRTVNELGDFHAEYLPTMVKLKVKSTGPETTRDIPLDRVAYDNEEALYLIRRLPLAEGYQTRFPIFPVQGGAVVECRIDVAGKEKLTIRAGTFDCYAVTLSVWSGMVKALEHKLWLSADKHRYVVKYDSGSAIMELVDVSQKQEDEPAIYHDDELGIAVTAPAGWYFYKNPSPGTYKMLLQMLPPELKAWALLSVGERTADETSARKVAGGDIDILKGYFKNYTVRPESWADLTVARMPAASYAADYEDKGKAMVEYRTYILGESMVYWFVFRIEKDTFEANKPGFDSIVRSFAITESTSKPAKTD
jgi:hypothetical protein